jgi:hypothetical protein
MRTATALVFGLALAAGLTSAPTAAAAPDDPVTLKWVLKEGDTFYAKSSAVSDMSLDVLGMNQDFKHTATTVARYKVKSVKPGATVVEMTYLTVKMEMEGLPGFNDIGDKMKGTTLTATFDDAMEITKVEGYEKMLDKIGGDDPMAKQVMSMLVSESSAKAMFGQVFIPLPAKAVKVGEAWTRTDVLPLAGLGDMTSKTKLTLDGHENNVAKIKISAEIAFKPGKGDVKGLPIKITKADLKTEKFTGTHTFDTKLGRLKDSKQEMTIKGTFTISAGGQDIEAGIAQKSVTTLAVTDKNPVAD